MDVTQDAPIFDGIPHDTPANAARSLFGDPDLRSILANLSQELCRPLISLRMGFDLLLTNADPPLSGDLRGHVDTMVGLCDELLSLTRGYLDYASLVQGTRPFSFGTYTISALIREIDRQHAPTASARKIGWECRLEGQDATVTTDASRFQQILGNLVANALNFTPEGGASRVSARIDGDHWIVVVADNGAGIPDDQIDRVFEPFYRFGRGGSCRVEGNGLGLASCQEMVAQLGGELRLESVVGQGTRAYVRFPIEPPARGLSASRRN